MKVSGVQNNNDFQRMDKTCAYNFRKAIRWLNNDSLAWTMPLRVILQSLELESLQN